MITLPDAAARGPGMKFLIVAVITLVMAVPLFFTFKILTDRQENAVAAAADIERGWGGAQTIAGPILAVPYSNLGTTVALDSSLTAIFLPKTLTIEADSDTRVRSRGAFDVNVYTAKIVLKGKFQRPNFAALGIAPTAIGWDQATLLLPLTDVHGLSENVTVRWGGGASAVEFQPGLRVLKLSGISAPTPIVSGDGDITFEVRLTLRGTRQLLFTAAGGDTVLSAKGNWPHPSFQGNFLPTARTVSAQGFSARWQIPHLARDVPQATRNADALALGLDAATFGLSFVQPVNFYLLVERALKYALLFIGLSFLSFFLIETLSDARLHGVQYLLIGGAQVVFYLLLLSFAEEVGFAAAYAIAATATVLLITGYGWSALKTRRGGAIVFAVLSVLYALLFVLLAQEDRALLIGACAAFAAISVTMYLTRNVDWHRFAATPKPTVL
jgi:inner membrane protein